MAKIRIVAVPPGQAPEWVRQEWIGLEIPIAEDTLVPEDSIQMGVKFGKPENVGGYPVETDVAVKILKEKSPKAARWWEENISSVIMPWLVFKKEVCELV